VLIFSMQHLRWLKSGSEYSSCPFKRINCRQEVSTDDIKRILHTN
jgi:hypothetical protein